MRKYLLGITKKHEVAFAVFGITTRDCYPEFTASFYTVKPIAESDTPEPEEYYQDLLDGCYSDGDKYSLCERFDCKPSELAGYVMHDKYAGPQSIIRCNTFPETYEIDGETWYFEDIGWGQHDLTDKIKIHTNQTATERLLEMWKEHHLKEATPEIIKEVEELQAQYDKIDVAEFITDYIQRIR